MGSRLYNLPQKVFIPTTKNGISPHTHPTQKTLPMTGKIATNAEALTRHTTQAIAAQTSTAGPQRNASRRLQPPTLTKRLSWRKKIDTVFCSRGDSAADIRRSLIDHDGYDAGITVRRSNKY